MAKAQETEDAELLALAALVNRETAEWQYGCQRYGEAQWDPNTEAKRALYGMLLARGVLS